MIGEELAVLLEPTVERLGYELADLEVRLGGKGGLIRLFIDREEGISLEDCEKVSRAVSALLDVEDPVPGNYNLEVSSPGLDRKLTKIAHFQRFIGETVQVKLRFPLDGRRRFRGNLLAQENDNIVIEVDGESYNLPLSMIDTARLVPAAA
jgi:ribosome maturation factor RimP